MKTCGTKKINTYVYIYHKSLLDDIMLKSEWEQKRGAPLQLNIRNLHTMETEKSKELFLKHEKNT